MKRLAIAAVGLALVVGIVVGGIVGNPFNGKASASTAVQQGEDQIALIAQGGNQPPFFFSDADWHLLRANYAGVAPFVLALDPADYPANSTLRLEAVWKVDADSPACLRLFDMTEGAAVPGSDLCHAGPDTAGVRLRSEPVALASGEHEYSVEDKGVASLTTVRIIVEWTGPYAVGGIAELPPLASAPGGSGLGGATYAVMAGAAAGVLAFAVLATLSVKRRRVR